MSCRTNGYPRQYRLRKKAQFSLCYEKGKRFHSAHFVIFVLPAGDDARQTGFAVSRRVGNAVKRNRIKRLLREFFRLRRNSLPRAWIVAVAKKGLRESDLCLKDVERELLPLMQRAARACGNPECE